MAEITTNSGKITVTAGSSVGKVDISKDYSQYYSNQARDWAIKMDGLVNNEDYSSKYYSNQARENKEITEQNLYSIQQEHQAISTEINQAHEDITNEVTQATNSISNQLTEALEEVNSEKIDSLNAIQNEKSSSLEEIETSKNNAIDNINAIGNPRNIGETVFSLLPLTDAGLHLLDGTLIEGLGSYRAFVQYIATLYGTGETHPSYFVTEEDWQASVANYGACGKFVYDSTANTVRLPKVTGIVEGTLDATALGDLVQAGLPNLNLSMATAGAHTHTRGTMEISGRANSIGINDTVVTTSGAFSKAKSASGNGGTTSGGGKTDLILKASAGWTGATSSNGAHTHDINVGNNIVGTTDTVQPQTIKGFMYLVVANSTKTDIEVDIDNVMTDLNGKVDKSSIYYDSATQTLFLW